MKKAFTDQTYYIPWQVVGIAKNKIFIYLDFTDPETISIFSEKDSLIVKFVKGSQILSYAPSDDELAMAFEGGADLSGGMNLNIGSTSFTLNQNFILNNVIPKQVLDGQGISESLQSAASIM